MNDTLEGYGETRLGPAWAFLLFFLREQKFQVRTVSNVTRNEDDAIRVMMMNVWVSVFSFFYLASDRREAPRYLDTAIKEEMRIS